jgi:hypothetical protein
LSSINLIITVVAGGSQKGNPAGKNGEYGSAELPWATGTGAKTFIINELFLVNLLENVWRVNSIMKIMWAAMAFIPFPAIIHPF